MTDRNSSRSGFLPARVIQLHASRFCNLACQHCYSASGPHARDALDPEAVIAALTTLRAEGYEVLSLSGGEPLLYPGFEQVVRAAAMLGLRVNLISNGAPVGGRLLDRIVADVHLVAISLDGAPERHNELRGDPGAFARAERAIERLVGRSVPFGLSFCVSRESIVDMPWALEYAASRGAALVQYHPFAATGRGRRLDARLGLEDSDRARAYVLATLLESADGPAVQLDLAPVAAARARRGDYLALADTVPWSTTLSDLVNPLIIDDAGRLLPFCYGIDPRLAIGRLGPGLDSSIRTYTGTGWHALTGLLDRAFATLDTRGERFVDWFGHLVETSRNDRMLSRPLPIHKVDNIALTT